MTAAVGPSLGSYRTGIITICGFALAATYSARKRTLWFSARWLRLVVRLPPWMHLRMVLLDRLETWRAMHVTVAVLALLPFWWHTDAGAETRLELGLKCFVILLIASGFLGAIIQELLPPRMRHRPANEVRVSDVEAAVRTLYVEAEERVLGHSEELVRTYLRNVRPLLTAPPSRLTLLWATLSGGDPAPAVCAPAMGAGDSLAADREVYADLIAIAERKIRLDHNRLNLRLGVRWLYFHQTLALLTGLLILFHVMGALYFAGV
jgi:hypothetical protein